MTFAFLLDSVPFTRPVILGDTSLGGSESACLGLARALQARGHAVHVFTTQLADDCDGRPDLTGVTWHHLNAFYPMNQFIEWDVVVALRMWAAFGQRPIQARMRLLWNQDLLVPGGMQAGVVSISWAVDHFCYVSEYHRKQWEQLQPELAPLGWVTRNGFDPTDLPKDSTKDPNRIIHISRPERGLGPLLQMWPYLKQQWPDATLQICRYSSMYDVGPGSWSDECARWDERVKIVNHEHGGITYLGELNKPALYKAISDAAVMWYPGVASFAETNCIAALEAQACGTPFVGSYRGALPETCPTGVLLRGDPAKDLAYQQASALAVVNLLSGCDRSSVDYRRRQQDGRTFAQQFTYAKLAQQWEQQIETWFLARYLGNRRGVLRQLLHEDDHVAAKLCAEQMKADALGVVDLHDAKQAQDFCDYVIAGKDHTAEHYGKAAIADPIVEAEGSSRFKHAIPRFDACTRVLDVACGNGSFAIALARANANVHVIGVDYSAANIERATAAAARVGVGGRCTFVQATVYDFDAQDLHVSWKQLSASYIDDAGALPFDGLFVGEFIEHVGNYRAVIDGLEAVLQPGAAVVYTCPHGACSELVPRGVPLRRGHVHRFHYDDIHAVWGPKASLSVDYLAGGITSRGTPIGNWLIGYTYQPKRPAGERPLSVRIQRTRPMPKLSVGMIVKDAENDLGRCLASVYQIADEIVIGDTGSTDTTKAIAESYGATVLDLPPVLEQPEGFSGTRNAVLKQCTGDWFLWIDADEALIGAPWLRRYLDGIVFNGFVIHQTHLYIDGPPTYDIPVRVFRNTGRVQFYGCVHEQPQDGDANTDIHPTLDVLDLKLAHLGYLTEEGREDKRTNRNLPLLLKDAKAFPDRTLGQVLLMREAVIQSDVHRADAGGLTERASQGYRHAIKIFLDHFDDPAHKYHKLARPWYEAALQHLGIGWEQEIALAGRQRGMGARQAAPQRVWVRDGEEYRRFVAWLVDEQVKQMAQSIPTFITDPDALSVKAPVVGFGTWAETGKGRVTVSVDAEHKEVSA